MSEHWLRIDDKADIISSLEMLSVALDKIGEDIAAWKWAMIAIHSALQGAIACHLRAAGNNLLVAKPEDADLWLSAYDQDTALPEMKMDWFLSLYDKLKQFEIEGYKFTPKGSQGRSIKKINEYRNDFVHFIVNGFSLEVSGLPKMCKDCINIINELDIHTLNSRWHDDLQHVTFRNLLDSCLEKINSLEIQPRTGISE
jgi:hypothetical protein